jgi:hypothetical protein
MTLRANNHIHGTGENDTFLEFANNSLIDAKTITQGNIHIQGEGALTLQNIEAQGGEITVIAENNMTAENVINYQNEAIIHDISLTSKQGTIEAYVIKSFHDLFMTANAMTDNTGLITADHATLNARQGIGTGTEWLTLDVNYLDAYNASTNGMFINNTKALILSDLNQ